MALTNRRQPGRKLLVVNDLTVPQAAQEIGCSVSHLRNALAGRAHPSDAVREGLPKLLNGMPLETIFEPELLAGEYTGRRGRRSQR